MDFRIILTAIAGIFVFLGIGSTFQVVDAGHVGVQTTLGEVNNKVYTEGLAFKNPISTIHEIDVRLQKAVATGASASTSDLQQVHTDVTVNYRIDGSKAPIIFKEFGVRGLDDKVLYPAISESLKAVTAKYRSDELISKREQVSSEIQTTLQAKVSRYDLTISSIAITNFQFNADYQAAVEAKARSVQLAAKAEQDLKRIETEAKQRVAQAEGEAKAIRAQAEAIRASGGSEYVQLQAIAKWDGKLPQHQFGSSVPFINIGK